jgi:hypothetical protein
MRTQTCNTGQHGPMSGSVLDMPIFTARTPISCTGLIFTLRVPCSYSACGPYSPRSLQLDWCDADVKHHSTGVMSLYQRGQEMTKYSYKNRVCDDFYACGGITLFVNAYECAAAGHGLGGRAPNSPAHPPWVAVPTVGVMGSPTIAARAAALSPAAGRPALQSRPAATDHSKATHSNCQHRIHLTSETAMSCREHPVLPRWGRGRFPAENGSEWKCEWPQGPFHQPPAGSGNVGRPPRQSRPVSSLQAGNGPAAWVVHAHAG